MLFVSLWMPLEAAMMEAAAATSVAASILCYRFTWCDPLANVMGIKPVELKQVLYYEPRQLCTGTQTLSKNN